MPIPAVQIPPDSTGKRIAQVQFSEVGFNTGTILFPLGDVVTGQTSAAFGIIVYIDGDISTGSVYVKMGHDSETNFIVGENLKVGGTTYAICASSTPYYSALVQLSGGNNPLQSAYVDQRGSLYTRGPEGWHKFDSLGRMQVAPMSWIGQYSFATSKEDELWTEKIVAGGSAVHHANTQSVILRCTDANGAKIQRTTNLYHHMLPGYAPNIEIGVSIGDNGKAGVVRRWGYFDDNDGLFYELNGTTMYVVMRTSASGAVIDYAVPRTEWNSDRLDGSSGLFNLSRHHAELSNRHMFWVDFQDSGLCRWGTQSEEGEKITTHRRATSNSIFAVMKTTTLPFRVEQYNTTATASTSEMRIYQAMAGVEGEWIHPYKTRSVGVVSGVAVANTTVPVFLSAYRAANTYANIPNRGFAYGCCASVYSTTQPIQLLYVKNPILSGVTGWTPLTSSSLLEKPTTGTVITANTTPAIILWSGILEAGTTQHIGLLEIHNVQSDGEIRCLANTALAQDQFVWVAVNLTANTSTTVRVVPTWREFY